MPGPMTNFAPPPTAAAKTGDKRMANRPGEYAIIVRWHGPFETARDARNWLRFGFDAPPFREGLYLAKGYTRPRLNWLYRFAQRRGHLLPKFIRRALCTPAQYLGESSNLLNRLGPNHHKLPKIKDCRAVWLGQIISQRFPLNADIVNRETVRALWPAGSVYETDRLVAEQGLIYHLQPKMNVEGKDRLGPAAFTLISRVNLVDTTINDFDQPEALGETLRGAADGIVVTGK